MKTPDVPKTPQHGCQTASTVLDQALDQLIQLIEHLIKQVWNYSGTILNTKLRQDVSKMAPK